MPVASSRIFRIDKFAVPVEARDAFLAKVKAAHVLLDSAEGCLQNHVLEQVSGSGSFNIVTLVEWRDQAAYDQARAAAQARHQVEGFDRQAMFETMGINPDLANYAIVPHAQ